MSSKIQPTSWRQLTRKTRQARRVRAWLSRIRALSLSGFARAKTTDVKLTRLKPDIGEIRYQYDLVGVGCRWPVNWTVRLRGLKRACSWGRESCRSDGTQRFGEKPLGFGNVGLCLTE